MTNNNPYYISAKTNETIIDNIDVPITATTARSGKVIKTNTPLVASNGELNAYDNREAMRVIAQTMREHSEGSIKQDDSEARRSLLAKFHAAYRDEASSNFAIFGEHITNTVRDTASRAGFVRRFIRTSDIGVGEIARIRYRRHIVNAFTVGPHSVVLDSRHDGRFIFPELVTIGASPSVNEKDLYQEGMSILDEKSDEALESIMVVEDLGFKNLLDAAVGASGAVTAFPLFTPPIFNSLKQRVVNTGGIPVDDCWMSNDLWNDIISSTEFGDWFDPITKHELVLTGRIGRLLDVNINTDAFLESRLRVLKPGEIYFLARPEYLGELITQQPLTSSVRDGSSSSESWRGWYIREIIAMGIANPGGVSYGIKI